MKPAAKPVPVSVASAPEGYILRRANEDVRTPAGAVLAVPAEALAEALGAEWNAQGPKINFAAMPLGQLAMTAIDVVAKDRARIIDALAAYATTELLCHRADHPPELAARQEKFWQTHLDWCAERFHAPLTIATGLLPIKQAQASLAALRGAVEAHDNFRLAGLWQAVETSGSLVLGLAVAEGKIDAAQAFDAAELDTGFQMEKWGEDPALAARRAAIRRDLDLCERWFGLLKQS